MASTSDRTQRARSSSSPTLTPSPRPTDARAATSDTRYTPPPRTRADSPSSSPPPYSAAAPTPRPNLKARRSRARTNSASYRPQSFLFTPTPTTCTTTAVSPPLYPKSASSPHLHSPPPAYPAALGMAMATESEDDGDGAIYTRSLRARLFGGGASRSREKLKGITTAPGKQCAGETETEADEPPRHLPTARIIPPSAPLVPPNTLQERLTPLLFEFSRLLSVVPAVFGTLYNIYHVYNPPIPPSSASSSTSAACSSTPHRIDYLVSALWAILTGYQCLALTTGLLARWRLYYPPLPTLIRLLALQAICWPATHLTLGVLRHEVRPAVCWAVVGTTTCVSRSVQLWVTSNLWWERRPSEGGGRPSDGSGKGSGGGAKGDGNGHGERERRSRGWRRWGGGEWGGRRWDWGEVCAKCALPAGVVYFVMAWAEALRREWVGC